MTRLSDIWLALSLCAFATGCGITDISSADLRIQPPSKLEVYRDALPVDRCNEISGYLEKTGVTDKYGQSHPGLSGSTSCSFSIGFRTSRIVFSSDQGFHCPCSGVTYFKSGACRANCRVTPECSTSICEHVAPIRATTIIENVIASADIDVAVATWRPGDQSPECFAERLRWEEEILDHEMHHVRDIIQLVEKTNVKWNAAETRLESLGSTADEAVDLLNENLNRASQDEARRLQEQFHQLVEEFHNTPEGRPIRDPDCSFCNHM